MAKLFLADEFDLKSSGKKWRSRTRDDLIIEVWEELDCESVGTRELEQIQQALREKFGVAALTSPASIARTLADEGAVLRHPEIFDCDLKWRERNLAESVTGELNFSSLSAALESFGKLEERRRELDADNDVKGLKQLGEVVAGARQNALLTARSKIVNAGQREEAREIAQWLAVWLGSPGLFPDWLELRQRSAEFRKKFSDRTA